MQREFDVGDHVTIVDEPYGRCVFGWLFSMNEYCSRDAVIMEKNWDSEEGVYYYKIDADHRFYNWCAGCFKQSDAPDFEAASEEEILEMLGIQKKEVIT